jgi:hypothetical protein
MSAVDLDNSNISPAGIRDKAQRMLGYILGVPLPGATPPTFPSNQPVQLGQPIQPKPTLGVRPLSMGAPAARATSPLGATLAPNTPAPAPPPGLNAGAELATLAPGTPTLAKPTPAESQAAGRAEYKASLPEVAAPAGSADWYGQRAARAEFQNEHPWGSPVSSHPGTLGKIGHTLATIGNVAGDILDPRAMAEIPGTQLNRQLGLASDLAGAQKADEAAQQQKLGEARLGDLQAERSAAETRQALDQQRLDNLKRNPADKMLTHGVDQNGNAVVTFQRRDGSVYTVPAGYKAQTKTTQQKPFTNPFEAFAYGSPAEKKAAQNFLALEKRTGAQYRQPSEIDERYRLYKKDPAAYQAMFGTKGGGGISQATATKMLNYFDRRRREVTNDFTLSDQDKQQKLAEIQKLEQPFMDAAHGNQPGNGGAGGQLPPGWTRNPR